MTPVITEDMVKEYLPNELKRRGAELRTWVEPSKSGEHLSLNLDKGVFYDFHTNSGGSLVSLLRQFGAPISKEMAGDASGKAYQFQMSVLKSLKSQGRSVGCGTQTAVWHNKETGAIKMVARVMCLKWNCPRCGPFLQRVWTEKLFGVHFWAIFLAPKGYSGIGRALDRTKRRAKRRGQDFEWLLLQANDSQVLFVDSRSSSEAINWLGDEPYLERVALMPTWKERNDWLGRGLEKMESAMHWKNKVRHSRGLLTDSDGNNRRATENRTSPSEGTQEATSTGNGPQWERLIVPYPIEQVVEKLEREGCIVQWASEEGNLAFVMPPRNGPIRASPAE